MSKVFSNLKPTGSVGRNGFDLSRRSVFNAKVGQILPVFCQATVPDGEYSIDVRQLLRTQPLQTAAFTGFSVNYDFFFVPNNYGYSSFNEFISQRKDERHVGQPTKNAVPVLPMKSFMAILIPCAVFDYMVANHFNAVGYIDVTEITNQDVPHFCICSENMPWASLSLEVIRSLDMFGYGNYLPMIKMYAQSVWRDLVTAGMSPNPTFTALLTQIQTSSEVSNVLTWGNLYTAMLTLIRDTETSNDFPYHVDNFADVSPTLWPFLSYNKAFYEYYRSIYYDEEFQVQLLGSASETYKRFEYVQLFNLDDFSASFDPSTSTDVFARLVGMLCPKQHLYKKDLFTGVLPSTQFGDVSVMIDNRDWLKLYVNTEDSIASSKRFLTFDSLTGSSDFKVGYNLVSSSSPSSEAKFRFDPGLAISVLEQRRADAMQRFKERMMRAGNKVSDVFKAHGWSAPYSASESSPVWLGTFDGRLEINTVAATTTDGTNELGQLGANGVAVVKGNKIKFKSHDFGQIVGVFYIVKDAEYDAYGIEKQHCLTDPFDYPYPELQNISLHPIDVLELSAYLRFDNIQSYVGSGILGYLPRFMEYKTGVDKVHGEFYSAPIVALDSGRGEFLRTRGVFADWVTPREDINVPTDVSFLYQAPNIADNIFMQQSTALQSSDPFLVNCLFDVMAVEPISVIGLPI